MIEMRLRLRARSADIDDKFDLCELRQLLALRDKPDYPTLVERWWDLVQAENMSVDLFLHHVCLDCGYETEMTDEETKQFLATLRANGCGATAELFEHEPAMFHESMQIGRELNQGVLGRNN